MGDVKCRECEDGQRIWMRNFALDINAALNHEDSRALKALSASPEFAAVVSSADGDGWTLLHKAVGQQLEGSVEFLLKNGANPNRVNHSGHTAMHVACSTGHDKIIGKLMKARGSLAMPVDCYGYKPLDYGPWSITSRYSLLQTPDEKGGLFMNSSQDELYLSVPILDTRHGSTYNMLRKGRLGRYQSSDSLLRHDKENESSGISATVKKAKRKLTLRPLRQKDENSAPTKPPTNPDCIKEDKVLQTVTHRRTRLGTMKGFQHAINTIRSRRSPASPSPQESDIARTGENVPEGRWRSEARWIPSTSPIQTIASALATIPEYMPADNVAVARTIMRQTGRGSPSSIDLPTASARVMAAESVTKDLEECCQRLAHNPECSSNLAGLVEECDLRDDAELQPSASEFEKLSNVSGLIMNIAEGTMTSSLSDNDDDDCDGEPTPVNMSNIAQPGSAMRADSESCDQEDLLANGWKTPLACSEVSDDLQDTRVPNVNVERMFGQPTPRQLLPLSTVTNITSRTHNGNGKDKKEVTTVESEDENVLCITTQAC